MRIDQGVSVYLEIDEGYWEHPKTLDLCARLGDDQADAFPPRLWKWACRCARDGHLGKIAAYAFERVVRYAPVDGKCFEAFLAAVFLDQNVDGEVAIHNWMQPGRTGRAIARMEAKAEENRQRRADARAKHEARRTRGQGVPASYQNRTGTIPSQTRPDTDKAQTSPGTDQSSDPDLSCPAGRPAGRGRKAEVPLSEAFVQFWSAYPRKVGKLKAWKAWPGDSLLPKILEALVWQTKSVDWTKDRGTFVPHPATYLGQGRWEDEPSRATWSGTVSGRQRDLTLGGTRAEEFEHPNETGEVKL